ncbi:hypothetical protein [Rhodoflexus sp.]
MNAPHQSFWLLAKTLLSLRMAALRRSLLHFGWWRLLLLAALVFWAIFRLVALQSPLAWLSTALVMIGGLHFGRNDRFFLQTLSPDWAWLMRAEYMLLAFPFLVAMAQYLYWQGIVALLILLWLLPDMYKPAFDYKQTGNRLALLPARMYEWRAGLRRNGWMIISIWLLAAIFYWALVAQVAFLLLYLLIIGSFYISCEPRIWLDLQNAADTRRFLWQKIKQSLALTVLGSLPFYLLIGVFHIQQAWLIVLCLVLTSAYISYAIFLKYALYSEGRSLEPFMLQHLIFVGSCAVPVLLPIAVYFGWSNYRKARRHLSDLFGYA